MARFDKQVALVKKLIKKNGQQVTLRTFADGAAPDPDKPWRSGASTSTDQTIEAVFLDYAQQFVDGTEIKTGDQQVLMPSEGLTSPPTLDGLVLRGSETWKIINCKPLNPNGQTIMYDLQVRQ